jgi:hypothetical protein
MSALGGDASVMDHPPTSPPMPAEYYRRHASRVRQLAGDVTTAAIREQLLGVAQEYDRLAVQVESTAREAASV